jgi:fumarylacetoacetate (FAA) hydrolase
VRTCASMRLATVADAAGGVRTAELAGDAVHMVFAPSMLAWLSGEGHGRTCEERPLADVRLLAPIPDPPSVRDFYAFERHVAAGWRRRGAEIPAYWYQAPAFYFSNPASIHGPGETVVRPPQTRALDFELEIAAIIGAGGEIAGFTLMNDWSARDVQAQEVTVGLGPHKSKDFATSLGPWLATPDELPYRDGRLQLEVTVTVNGCQLSVCDTGEQHYAWPELVAHAAQNARLRPGDVLGSGTLAGGCLLELGPQDFGDGRGERWIEPGDVVSLAGPGLGTLATPIAG